ncbi:MAG: hypothetical protein U0401_12920 [Anaerolineae bacterium]
MWKAIQHLAYAAHGYTGSPVPALLDEPPSWRSFNRVSPLDLLRISAWRNMDEASRHGAVRSPHLRQLLGRLLPPMWAAAPITPGHAQRHRPQWS